MPDADLSRRLPEGVRQGACSKARHTVGFADLIERLPFGSRVERPDRIVAPHKGRSAKFPAGGSELVSAGELTQT